MHALLDQLEYVRGWLHTCMYPSVIFIVGSTGERFGTPFIFTDVWSFSSVSSHVDFTDIRCRERTITGFVKTLEWSFT